ncbi:MAG: acyl-CoA thioester hydrolase [Halothiobacillaceae bacterium]|nr:MAG: acyl-CoA thioester hydrolase [Halothiobacillaceae bacterium]
MKRFSGSVRVYYEDTDSAGVVYHANYLKFMERARTEMLREMGVEQNQLALQEGVLFVVRSATIDYLKPARFNDLLQVTAAVVTARRASLEFVQQILRHETVRAVEGGSSPLLCTGRFKIACLDAKTFRPAPIPHPLDD